MSPVCPSKERLEMKGCASASGTGISGLTEGRGPRRVQLQFKTTNVIQCHVSPAARHMAGTGATEGLSERRVPTPALLSEGLRFSMATRCEVSGNTASSLWRKELYRGAFSTFGFSFQPGMKCQDILK